MTDTEMIMQCDPSVRHRRRIEIQIVRKTIRELTKAGYMLTADNGEYETKGTERELMDNLFACDEAHLRTVKDGRGSSVFFVMGNDGYDVINDYGMSLEPVMNIVDAYVDKLESEGR